LADSRSQPLFERALHITETRYGPQHPDVATALNNLGVVLRDLGKPDQARPLFEQVLHITERTYGPTIRMPQQFNEIFKGLGR
jgi:tetratricopeptide (TPR) repeat protein